MATDSSPLPPRKPVLGRIFGGSYADSLLEARLFPYILSLLLGILLALAASILISRGQWQFAVPLVFIVPVAIFLIRYPFIAVLVWLLVFPFFVKEIVPGSRYMYWVIHRAMIPGAFGLALLGQLLPGMKKRTVRFGIPEACMVLFLFLGFGNILMNNTALVFTLIRFYDRIFVPFCMYGLIRLTASREEDLRLFVWIAPVIVISQTAIGLVSWYVPGLLPDVWLNRYGERTVGTFGNPGVFTTTLMFCAIFLLQHGILTKSFWIKVISFSVVALSLTAIILSFSRGSWLGALIVCAGVFFLYPRLMTRLGVIFLMLVLVLGVTSFQDTLPYLWDRLNDADTAQGRILGGAAAVKMVEQKPVFGWGYNAYEQFDELYREPVLGLAVNDEASSHNTFLLIAAEMGLAGFFLYMLPLLWWFLKSRKAWPFLGSSGFISKQMLAMLWLLMLDHIAVAAFTDMFQSNLFGRTMWWLILGLIASLVSPYLQQSSRLKTKHVVTTSVVALPGND